MPSAPPGRPIRVVLIGFSTRSDNLGVGALTVSQIEMLRDIARNLTRAIEVTVVDNRDPRQPYVDGPDVRTVDLDTRFLVNPAGFLATVRRADLVIDIGAGDSFADIYGPSRLRRMFAMKFLTHLSGTPLVLAPQTIGPFTKDWSKRLALASIRSCALVTTRDALSTQALIDLGYVGPVIEASDVALLLPFDPPPPRPATRPLQVGLNVSGLLMNGGYTSKNEFGITLDYPQLIRELIRFFESEGATVHLVAHVLPDNPGRTHIEDDFAACATFAEAFPRTVLAPRFGSPSEAKSYIAGLDFFIGARMHACIASFSTGVAVVPMAYSRKFAGLFGSLGYSRTVDCTSEGNDAILASVATAWAARASIASEVAATLDEGQRRLARFQRALTHYLSSVRHT